MDDNNSFNNKDYLNEKIRTKERGEQTLSLAEKEINRIASNTSLPTAVVQVAKAIYRRSLDCKFIENRSIGIVAAASVYAACRVEKQSITVDKISEFAIEIDTQRAGKSTIINRTYSEMSSQLELRTGPIEPETHVPNLINKLELSEKVKQKSIQICDSIDPEIESGRSPIALAAASVYLSSLLCNQTRTQMQVSDAANVSEKTIRVRYQELVREMADLDS